MMEDTKLKDRREFIKDGLRAILLGGVVFSGLFLGWRGQANSGTETSCSLDLPCRSCSKITSCIEPPAIQEKDKMSETGSFK